ncbi:MAG TPA: outer membrane protein assembly factor BamD [Terriglobales bacterium]|nr:outer membrane protein assembly factor BamD [Terriglobales bacterium]
MFRKWLCLSLLPLILSCAAARKETPVLGAEDQFSLAKNEYEKKKYSDAVTEFQKLIFNYPGAAFVDSAQYLMGMCYFNEKDYSSSVGEFKKVLSSFSESPLADDASFMIAYAHFMDSPRAELDQTNSLKAIQELKDFLDEYPDSRHAQEAQKLLFEARTKQAQKLYNNGRIYYKLKQYEAALIYLQDVLDQYSETRYASQASFLIAESYREQKKSDLAELEYRKFLEKYPDDKLAGKVKSRLGKLNKEIQAKK